MHEDDINEVLTGCELTLAVAEQSTRCPETSRVVLALALGRLCASTGGDLDELLALARGAHDETQAELRGESPWVH